MFELRGSRRSARKNLRGRIAVTLGSSSLRRSRRSGRGRQLNPCGEGRSQGSANAISSEFEPAANGDHDVLAGRRPCRSSAPPRARQRPSPTASRRCACRTPAASVFPEATGCSGRSPTGSGVARPSPPENWLTNNREARDQRAAARPVAQRTEVQRLQQRMMARTVADWHLPRDGAGVQVVGGHPAVWRLVERDAVERRQIGLRAPAPIRHVAGRRIALHELVDDRTRERWRRRGIAVAGSTPAPPQSAPPTLPGTCIGAAFSTAA